MAGWVVAFAASLVVGGAEAHAARWTVPKLVAHADGYASRCKVAPHWGPKQNQCAALVVFKREPRLGREAVRIARCETGGTWDERVVARAGYLGLGQFAPGTWRRLPSWISRHSPFSPPWAFRGMRYLRLGDGDWHQWPACSRKL